MTTYAFALLWYTLLSGSGYLLYRYYILAERLFLQTEGHHRSLAVVFTCLLYLVVEVLQFVYTKTMVKRPLLHYTQEEANEGVFVIIAAHKASTSLANTLPTVLENFPPSRIWVADNGHERDADTQRLCQELGVQYRFYDVPNKTWALYRTAKAIRKAHEDEAQALVLLDDDTELPPDFFVRKDLLAKPLVAGYCVGITVKRTPPYNVWEHLVDFEYRTISYRNEGKATLHFLHGICAVYHTTRMLTIYSKLCTLPHGLPFGEDSFAGVDCRLAGYRLLQDNMNVVTTYCPRRLFPPLCGGDDGREQGFGASSLWKQRALRWYLSWPRRLPSELALALCYDAGSWTGNVLYRLDLAWYLFLLLVSSWWPFYIVYLAVHGGSWAEFGMLHAGLSATAMCTAELRYLAFPAKLKENVQPRTVLMKPLMNLVVCVLMASSFVISLLWYIPFKRINYRKCYTYAE
jgi:hypothetical protein